jgi:hypothetical protein
MSSRGKMYVQAQCMMGSVTEHFAAIFLSSLFAFSPASIYPFVPLLNLKAQ